MNVFNQFREKIQTALEELARRQGWPEGLPFDRVTVEPPRDSSHGDISTNAAMLLAKPIGSNPRAIAGPLAEALSALEEVESAEVAGPGFINLRLAPSVWLAELGAMGVTVPRRLGGMNCPILVSNVIYEMMTRADPAVTGHYGFFGGIAGSLLLYSSD